MAKHQVQIWKPIHEQVALLAASGQTPKVIAKKVGKEPSWVSRILLDPRAVKIMDDWLRDLRERLFQKYDDQVLELAGFAIKNLRRTLMGHPDPETQFQMKQHQDRVSVDMLKIAGVGFQDRAGGATVQLTKEESKLLIAAINKSDQAKEIFEAEYEVLDEPNGKSESEATTAH